MDGRLAPLENLCNTPVEKGVPEKSFKHELFEEIIPNIIQIGFFTALGICGGYKLHQYTNVPGIFEAGLGVIGFGYGCITTTDDD